MGRYDVKDPLCTHTPKGRIEAGDPQGAFASTYVCDRPECIADAKEWAWASVHVTPSEFIPMQFRPRTVKTTSPPEPVQATFADAGTI